MNYNNTNKTKEIIDKWLGDLGYSYDLSLHSQILKISYNRPSYKVVADIILKNIKSHNPTLEPNEAWRYTTKFVNGMKSNMISNNNYFQLVFKKGLFSPFNNKQNIEVNLFDSYIVKNNNYNFLKNLSLDIGKNKKTFDFIILINELPLMLIEIVDKDCCDSFEKAFIRIEDAFEKLPMFFNYNQAILLTDGSKYKLGTIYDFPEDYIEFEDKTDGVKEDGMYSKKTLEEFLKTKNILKYLKGNKDILQITNQLEKNYKKELISDLTKDSDNNTLKKTKMDIPKPHIQKNDNIDDEDELSFLASIFKPDLDEIIESKEFKTKLKKLREVPDFRENKAYIEDVKINNNIDTLDTFAKANEGLVIKEVYKNIGYETTSMNYDDIYQLGYIGLLKALERFDLERENEFSTYATYWIRQTITRGIQDQSLVIRLPVHRWDAINKLREIEYESDILFGKVDYDWISEELNKPKESIMELVSIRNTYMSNVSLDTFVGADQDTTLAEFIADESCDIEKIVGDVFLKEAIEDMLNTIDDRSREILVKRFGLDDGEPMTLEEIGKIYNVTRERIRQIESKALRQLRHPTRSKKLKDYCEG